MADHASSDYATKARAALVARASYGRLVAILAARSGDIAGAEDALSEAFHSALTAWPKTGLPDKPEAWLVRVAQNRMTDAHRRALRQQPLSEEHHGATEAPTDKADPPDPRFGLLFACAHPAIAERARGPLMLQAVLGFTATEIARAYVASPAATAKLLTRAKARIKANAIPFDIPDSALRPDRVRDVAEAIYGCYALVWMSGPEADAIEREAVYLADLLATEMYDDPEALGLSALLAYLHARRDARMIDGVYQPLGLQEPALWDRSLIDAADRRLEQAFALGAPGRFQIEAAIQQAHIAGVRTGATDWPALLALHDALLLFAPTLGGRVGRISAIAEVHGPHAALVEMDRIADDRLSRFQPYWATRAHLLAKAKRIADADTAYARAISLTPTKPVRDFLTDARGALSEPNESPRRRRAIPKATGRAPRPWPN